MSNNEKYNTAKLSEREMASAVFRLSEARFAKTDFELLKSLKPSAANDPQYRFSPSRYHNYILRELLQLKSEKDIIAARRPTPTEEETPPTEEETSPAEEETPPAEEETPPTEGEKTTSESATVPGSSAAGQNIKSTAGQNKKKSQKKTNTPTSTGKTSSTKTSSGQS